MEKTLLILISGHPATGKTTLGKKIVDKFNLPLISPDGIKETIWDCVGWEHNQAEWNKFGKASFEVMYYFVQAMLGQEKSLIIEANFNPEINETIINELKEKYNCKLIQIYCYADKKVIAERFEKRIESDNYHPGHANGLYNICGKEEYFARLGEGNKLLDINGETLEVNTTDIEKIDYDKIFNFISSNK